MKLRVSILAGLCSLVMIAGVSASGQSAPVAFNSLSRSEIELLLLDVGKSDPEKLERLANNPALRRQQLEDLRQLLAFASQTQREGIASEPTNRQELDSIRAEVLAINYDREINKDKGVMPAFGFITEKMIAAYWSKDGQLGNGERTHEAEFNDFFNAKIAILRASNPDMKDREISEEEKTQARDVFARTRIYKAEYEQKVKDGELPKEFIDKTNLQVKLQQAQFLAGIYSDKVADKTKATDEDIAKYIAEHSELDPKLKRTKAQGILDRVKAGEDFATLANTYSDDPGNKNADGEPQGGLYRDVANGTMVPAFEQAALALQPGQIAPNLVETDFGYHIIKLEKKRYTKRRDGSSVVTYDVRHILISTGYKDPGSPDGREVPINDHIRTMIENEKQKQLVARLVAENKVEVPDDFAVPAVSDVQKQPIKKN